ncbi:MAG: branched-chain amino acid ABC transporter permease [Alphaproteobacteria bacterium]|nr:branched-chain amino acid ABC transporter permease [Alphaproteobacteria bacterium]
MELRKPIMFVGMALLLVMVGVFQSWSLALTIVNLCIISAIMAMGVNMQWGYAGLFNAGVMGFAALGGLAAIVIGMPPVQETWQAGGGGILATVAVVAVTVGAVLLLRRRFKGNKPVRTFGIAAIIIVGYFVARAFFMPAVDAIESIEPAKTGYLGGLGLPILLSWIVGGVMAACAAWIVGKVALGLRSDYLAIATLGISEIIIAILKNEEWLTRGVKNVNGLPRPTPYEVDLQQEPWVLDLVEKYGLSAIELSSIIVKVCYAGLFLAVLLILLFLAERALHSPWGRMMRAIRDNETAANAMGKDVTGRHLEVFILGSAVIGIAGAMLVTLDGQFTPTSYQPLRFTFLIWVMVIVGGAGNNFGAIMGGFVVWFTWIQAEPVGAWFLDTTTAFLAADDPLRLHLIEGAAYMRPITMGVVLLLVLRFAPKGLIPEQTWHR